MRTYERPTLHRMGSFAELTGIFQPPGKFEDPLNPALISIPDV
jgi:hypothetical protein